MTDTANWVQHPVTLKGKKVNLIPLEEDHFEAICDLGMEKAIWQFSPTGVDGTNRENHLAFLDKCLQQRMIGEWYPFIVIHRESGEIAGFTIFHSISQTNKSLEIGCTWFPTKYWSTGINTECKFLMLQYCFEVLGTMRVQIKSSDTNVRSRKAIEKIGATFEGVLRKDKVLAGGTIRNAAYYSIIDDDWATVKKNLQDLSGM